MITLHGARRSERPLLAANGGLIRRTCPPDRALEQCLKPVDRPGRVYLGQFLGSAAGLSAAVITRLTETWKAEQRAFAQRDLS
jgi:hypothetical protein